MARRTALQLVNNILGKIRQKPTTDLTALTAGSNAEIILDYLNDAIIEISNSIDGKWYTLLKTRKWRTSFNVVVTVVDYTTLSGATITITFNGTATTLTEGVEWTAATDNDTTATSIALAISTALSGVTATSVLAVATAVTAPVNNTGMSVVATDAANTELTIALAENGEYAVASDFSGTHILLNMTDGLPILSEFDKTLSYYDPDEDQTGTPEIYTIENSNYKLYPIPGSVLTLKEKYWKEPTLLTANTDLYDLPSFVEAALIRLTEASVYSYLDKTNKGDRAMEKYERRLLPDAKSTNAEILDKLTVMNSSSMPTTSLPIAPVRLPSNYPRNY